MPFQVCHSIEAWRHKFGPKAATALTVGNFDGLHLGHQELLRGVVDRARQAGLLAVAVTFDPHPTKLIRPAEAPPLIATLAQRLRGIEQLGVDAALVLRFDRAFSELSPENFLRTLLVDTLQMQLIRVGENFRFGYRHAGNVSLLQKLGMHYGFEVELVPPVIVRGEVVSSSAIRSAIQEGNVGRAMRLLGRPFALTGQIQIGTGQGHKLLVPTLNLVPEQEVLPKVGVYATDTIVGGRIYHSATNVGYRPTLEGSHLTIESHLFDFSGEITSGALEVHFWKRLRDEKKFPSVAALRAQIQRDLDTAQAFFRRLSQAEIEGLPRLVRKNSQLER